ncbi:MAG: alkaline phosphatase D family protein [Planctomycetes bacterium]|nr:alkaline phosphatase D family protein [Planctomycetota bacterium]
MAPARMVVGSLWWVTLLLAMQVASSAATAQDAVTARQLGSPRVMQGPMLGAAGPHGMTVWARLNGPFAFRVRYGTDRELRHARWSTEVRATVEGDWTVRSSLSGLTPQTRYYYRVQVAGRSDKYLKGRVFSFLTPPADDAPAEFEIAFGSCARYGEDRVQPIWAAVERARPSLFCWFGDNIYGDSTDPAILAEEYRRQRDVPGLQPILHSTPQLAVWDDHDFGVNDYDRRHPRKRESLEVFSRYWANPGCGTEVVPGVFFHHRFGGVDLFFLDIRYHRDPNAMPDGPGKTMLGAGQRAWLEAELLRSKAPFKVLFSGSGWSAAKGQGGDSWASYMHERDALFEFIRTKGIRGVVLASGDTHVAELNCIPWSERGGYDLYDFVSSPLAQRCTDSWLDRKPEIRIRPVWFGSESFGVMRFDLRPADPTLEYRALGPRGEVVIRPLKLRASELTNGTRSWDRKIDPIEARRRKLRTVR